MKRSKTSILATGFKTLLAIVLISCISFLVLAMKTKKMVADVWSQLGLDLPQAQMNMSNSFIYGQFQYYGAKNAKNIALADRVSVVTQLLAEAKKYYNSKEFKDSYAKYRMRGKPEEPTRMPITVESIKADEKFRLETSLKQAEAGLNSPNPKIKNGAPQRIENIKKEIAALDDPNNPKIKKQMTDADKSYEYAKKLHGEAMKKFEAKYPEDPKTLLKTRLQEILNITTDVDYAAELTESKGKKFFVNQLYEKKPKEWKLAFRAGKTATDAARAAVEQWLKELQ